MPGGVRYPFGPIFCVVGPNRGGPKARGTLR